MTAEPTSPFPFTRARTRVRLLGRKTRLVYFIPFAFPSPRTTISLLLLALLLLQHLLDDLLLLDQEGAHDAVPHAVAASRTAVGALDGLLRLGDLRVLAGSEGGNLWWENDPSA